MVYYVEPKRYECEVERYRSMRYDRNETKVMLPMYYESSATSIND